MKHIFLVVTLFLVLIIPLGCSRDSVTEPTPPSPSADVAGIEPGVRLAALEYVRSSGWEQDVDEMAALLETDGPMDATSKTATGWVVNFQREVLPGGLVHYSARVRTGPGRYDFIGIHRVVKEQRPNRPLRTRSAVFLQHGASKDFVGMFLPANYSDNLPDDFGFAQYLARNDVDVWGIDQAWNVVPAEETNFDFMAEWGIPRHVRDLRIGLEIARLSRLLTGSGFDKMTLLGYSFGAEFGYALLDGEATLPPGLRQVGGYIPVDMVVKTDNAEMRQFMCDYGTYIRDRYASGYYNDDSIMRPAGELARDDPDGDSPMFPGMTNLQVAMYLGGGVIYPPTVHFLSGIMQDDFPVAFRNVSIPAWIDFLCSASPHEPALAGVDQAQQICDDAVPWDDHLGAVSVPIFYVGAQGGMGDLGLLTLSFLGSTDIQTMMVSTDPDILLDFGHIDLFLGQNAPGLVWQPILEWIRSHGAPGPAPGLARAAAGPE